MFDLDRLEGIFPAMFTPLTEEEQVDETGLRNLVNYLLNAGVHGLFVLGSGGEFPVFTPTERGKIIKIVVDEVNGKVPIIVGTSAETTRKAVINTQIASREGADVAVILPPYYFGSTQEEIIEHYKTILSETDIPVLIYNNPFSTKVKISLDTLETLAAKGNIVAIKDTTCDFYFHEQLVEVFEDTETKIFQGDERLAAASFLIGADGGTLGLASIVPKLFVDLYHTAKDGDYKKAFEFQNRINSLLQIFEVAGETDASFFSGGKYALKLLEICKSSVSKPFRSLTEEQKVKVEEILKEHEIL